MNHHIYKNKRGQFIPAFLFPISPSHIIIIAFHLHDRTVWIIIIEYIQDLLVHQAIIGNVRLSGRKWVREPNVRVSKKFNPNRREIRVLEYRRGVKDPNTTQWRRGPVSRTDM